MVSAQESEKAFEFNAAYTGDFGRNFSGGVEQKNAYLGNLDITANFNTENAKLWKGGTFFIYLLNNHGTSLSQYVGDLQGVDNIEADAHTRLYQFWYMQKFGKLSFTIGQHDLNSEFSSSEYGGTFINSSFGIQPDISGNVPISIFPIATLGVILKYEVNNQFSILTAIYDGDPGTQAGNPNSLKWKLADSNGILNILELQYELKNKTKPGTYKIGAWSHSADNHYGIYAIADQKLLNEKNDPDKGLGFFTQFGIAPQEGSVFDYYASFGLRYSGLFGGRKEDNLGLALGHASMSHHIIEQDPTVDLTGETVIELVYEARINDYITIKPDLQYVINPGATSAVKNSLTGIIRTVLEF
jgi:porin